MKIMDAFVRICQDRELQFCLLAISAIMLFDKIW